MSQKQQTSQCEVLKDIGQTLLCEVCKDIRQNVEDSSGHRDTETTNNRRYSVKFRQAIDIL